MASARNQQTLVARADDRCAQVDTRDRPARALARVTIECDHQRRLAGLFLDPSGHDPDYPGVPSFTRNEVHGTIVLRGELRFGCFLHFRLDSAAFLVERG